MLSRIAESLFWIGRYVERADDTARILDAFLARLLEDPWSDEDAACRSLLAILGVTTTDDERLTAGDALERLAFDTEDPSAIAGAVAAARENARGARETISSEMWECLNVTWHTLQSRRARAVTVPELHPGTGGGTRGARRVDDEPRRRLALPDPGPFPGTGRHDRTAAVGSTVDERRAR
jgi:uncharacterized alpha-E superfamily protein